MMICDLGFRTTLARNSAGRDGIRNRKSAIGNRQLQIGSRQSQIRNHYQSLYFVPLRASPSLLLYTSNTSSPPQEVESGLSLYDLSPHSVSPVIGSIGRRLRNRTRASLVPTTLAGINPSTSILSSLG